jgi:signal transduction histidine kinase/ligand-binding sensor domain-containing protein/CheY-like chemotaxis protein/AraC-like DNA-binding protein
LPVKDSLIFIGDFQSIFISFKERNLFIMKYRTYILYLFPLLFCVIYVTANAQELNYHFEYLTDRDGLSQNSVWSIYQDQEGFMWFGTQDGLNKYDGYEFTVFKPDPDNPGHSLAHNRIMDIKEDSEGRLWVVTWGGGLHEINKKTHEVTRHGFSPISEPKWNIVHALYEDRQGYLWSSAMGGLIRLEPVSKKFTLYPTENIFQVTYAAEDNQGRFWVVTSNGLYLFDRENETYQSHGFNPQGERETLFCLSGLLDSNGILWLCSTTEGLFRFDTNESNPVLTKANLEGFDTDLILPGIYEDRKGFLWVCTQKGLFRINQDRNYAVKLRADPFQPGSLNHQIALSIFEDKEGILWFGTEGGVNKMLPENRHFQSYQIKPSFSSQPVNENNIQSIIQDQQGDIWLAIAGDLNHSIFKKGLYRYNAESDSIEKFSADSKGRNKQISDNVLSMFEDSKNRFWIATEEGLYLYKRESNSLKHYPARLLLGPIEEDKNGKLWMYGRFNHKDENTQCAKLQSFDPETETFQYYEIEQRHPELFGCHRIHDFIISKSEEIWLAHTSKDQSGISVINPVNGTIKSYSPDPTDPKGKPNDMDFRTIYEDRSGEIWAGSNQGGLHRYNSISDAFNYYTTEDGLPSNHVVSIIEDNSGFIWLGTNKGLSRFDTQTESFRNFNVSNGLPANQFRERSVYARGNKLMFGTVNGFIVFNPDSIGVNVAVPPVHITAFNVAEEQRTITGEEIVLPFNKNFVSFEFVALNYEQPEKNQYKYRLEGVDRDWVFSGARRFASYSDLDPGSYTFQVQGSNNNDIWNEQGAALSFMIQPPWWQTSWAYAFYALMGLVLLFFFRQQIVRRERLKSKLQLQTMEAGKMQEMDKLKSRFFANISHEFRTPLTLILGPLEKFIAETEDKNKLKVFKMMQRNTRRLLNLINQLLELSHLESGKLSLKAKPVALNPFLKSIVFSFSSLAERKQINYRFRYPDDNTVAYMDSDKVEKIIANLLSNAFRYTPSEGEVVFTARFEKQEAEEKYLLEICVEDSGQGMSEEEQRHIFDRFYQIETAGSDSKKGTGIGLALVAELVDLYGGELSVESSPGQGSKFSVKLPLQKAAFQEVDIFKNKKELTPEHEIEQDLMEDISDSEKITEENSEAKPTVLVVEDNTDVRSFIKEILGDDYSLTEAEDGEEAFHLATGEIPDLIISDVMMPKMDGIELVKRLRQEVSTSHIPLVILTAKVSENSQVEGFNTGADAYITKPFAAEVLKAQVANLIETRKKLRERFSRDINLEPSSVKISSVDEKFIRRVKEVLEEHMPDLSFGVDQFSEEMNMSRIQFHRKLKALTNHTPAELIRTTRIKRAAELLEKGAGSVGEVAFMVGFNYSSYFTKCFQKQYGKTPSEFIAQNSTSENQG